MRKLPPTLLILKSTERFPQNIANNVEEQFSHCNQSRKYGLSSIILYGLFNQTVIPASNLCKLCLEHSSQDPQHLQYVLVASQLLFSSTQFLLGMVFTSFQSLEMLLYVVSTISAQHNHRLEIINSRHKGIDMPFTGNTLGCNVNNTFNIRHVENSQILSRVCSNI